MPVPKTRWDIFCTVVDNYGDIGVTWRLARQLVAEHGLAVRLWVDDLRAFERICPRSTSTLRNNRSRASRCGTGRATGRRRRRRTW